MGFRIDVFLEALENVSNNTLLLRLLDTIIMAEVLLLLIFIDKFPPLFKDIISYLTLI